VGKKHFGGFLTGAAILAAAGVICRLLGVIIRIPLCNIVGNFGMGIYQMVFPLYALLLIISSAGVPVAISKMVARAVAGGKCSQPVSNDEYLSPATAPSPQKILFNSVILLGVIGLVMSALFMIFSYHIAAFQGNREIGVIYLAIAPSVTLVCIIAAFRGYFQGLGNMIPTATSQIIEQIVKLGAALTLAIILIKISVIWAVFGAILAVTISEFIALIFLIIVYLINNKNKEKIKYKKTDLFDIKLIWQILKQSIPITLMSAIFPLILVIDSLLVINMLTKTGIDHREATKLFGIQSGSVHTLINLPAVLGVAIATAVVPAVSSLLKQEKMSELRNKMSQAIKITIFVSIFFSVFYYAFPKQIIDLLYHGAFKNNPDHLNTATNLMKIESALILLIGIASVFTAFLQGSDRAKYPLIALGIGGAAKIVFQFCFIHTAMGIYAVSIGNVICFVIAAILNTIFALKVLKIKKSLWKNIAKVVVLTLLFMLFMRFMVLLMPENRWFVLLSGAVSLCFYVVLVALFGFLRFNINRVGNNKYNPDKSKGEK
jgi:stage V sporulation protein B